MLFGAYPIGPYEPDGPTIANGTSFLDQGMGDLDYLRENGLIYRYDAQGGTYRLIQAFAHLFGADAFVAFSLLSAVSFAAFVICGSWFLHRETRMGLHLAGILVLAFPEVIAVAGYPNSNLPALAFLAGSFLFTTYRGLLPTISGAVLFALAVACRFDAILLAPGLALLLWKGSRPGMLRLGWFALAGAIGLLLVLPLAGTSLPAIYRSLQQHQEASDAALTLANYVRFYPVVLVGLIGLGLYSMGREKRFWELGFATLSTVLVVLAYGWALTTGKYLLYLVLPQALVILYGLRTLSQWKPPPKYTVGALLAGAAIYAYVPAGFPAYHTTIHSHDGTREVTGLLATPFEIHKTKFRKRKAFREMADALQTRLAKGSLGGIAVRDNHEVSANLISALLRSGARFAFVANTREGKVFELRWGDARVPFIAFYQGHQFPESVQGEFVAGEDVLVVFWKRWPPPLVADWERERVFTNKMLAADRCTHPQE